MREFEAIIRISGSLVAPHDITDEALLVYIREKLGGSFINRYNLADSTGVEVTLKPKA